MNAAPRADGQGEASHGTTLGDVLYSDSQKARVPETEWVALLQAVAAGDQRALYAIYARTHRIVFTSVLRMVKIRETAEELTVDVFHDVWKRATGYQPAGGTVIGWIMNQARSRAIDRLRFDNRKKRTNSRGLGAHEGCESAAEDVLEARDQERRLKEALADLTPPERETIETAFFSEYTYHETATRLKQPLGTVKTRIRSALAKLRTRLIPGPEGS
jgi:RNA polymerase sigma-70 factor (ECF subfamily)